MYLRAWRVVIPYSFAIVRSTLPGLMPAQSISSTRSVRSSTWMRDAWMLLGTGSGPPRLEAQRGEPLEDDGAVARRQLHAAAIAPETLGCDQRSARSQERVVGDVPAIGECPQEELGQADR